MTIKLYVASLSLISLAIMASGQSVATAPAPPQLYDTTLPASSSTCTLTVPAGGDLQAAIDASNLGDTICLQAGATFTGNFILRDKTTGTGWLTIRTATPDDLFPPPGTRVGPSDTPQMATVLTPNVGPVFTTEISAQFYRLIGLELAVVSNPQPPENYVLVQLGDGNATSVSQVPSDIIIDRCYVHGNPTLDIKRGIQTNSARTAVIDSYVSEFHAIAQDAQAIGGWSGPGPFKIVNNYLEASGENVIFGGATAYAPELMPQDGDIEFNYFYKPLSWNPNDPSYGGIHWSVKNLFEIKDGNRFLVNGNIMENNWVDAQSGFAIFLQGLPSEELFGVAENVAFTNNIIKNSYSGVAFCGQCIYAPAQTTDPSAPNYADPNFQRVQEILFENNLFDNIQGLFWSASDNLTNIRWDHNTIINPVYYTFASIDAPMSTYVDLTNNIAFYDAYGFYGNGGLPFTSYLQQSIVTDNMFIDNLDNLSLAGPSSYPPGNLFPQIDPNALFVNYNGGSGGDYHLAANSPYLGAGTDGNDLGANIDTLDSATGNVIAGIMGAVGTFPTPPVNDPPAPPVTTPTTPVTTTTTPVTTTTTPVTTPVLTVTTISTIPPGLSITVDGQPYTAPAVFEWNAGTGHTISVNSVETNQAGAPFKFWQWSDAGAASHTVTAGSTQPTIIALFQYGARP